MNVVQRLRADNAELRAQLEAYADGFTLLRAHLDSDKLKGVDLDGDRKDWISVDDVRRWLACIENDALDPIVNFGSPALPADGQAVATGAVGR